MRRALHSRELSVAIAVTCGNCGVKLRFNGEHAGKETRCRACEKPLIVQGETIPDHDVFISYSVKDKPIADAACAALEAKKIRCWIAPRDVLAGRPWAGAIIDAISDARVMVLIYSANSNASPQVLREVERAVHRNVIIIPFRLDPTTLSKEMEFFISAAHWLDAMTEPVEAHIARLVSTTRRLLADAQPAIAQPTPQNTRKEPAPSQPTSRRRWALPVGLIVIALAVVNGLILWRQWSARPMASVAPPTTTVVVVTRKASPSAIKPATMGAVASAQPLESNRAIALPSVEHTVAATNGNHIDLLKLADPQRGAISGNWSMQDGKLLCKPPGISSFEFPYVPGDEYDYRITVTRTSGVQMLNMICGAGGHQFIFNVGGRRNTITGFEYVAGRPADANEATQRRDAWIENGKSTTILVKVRRDAIEGYFNGELVTRIVTDYSNLSAQTLTQDFHRRDTLGLRCINNNVTVESVDVTEVTGHGQVVQPDGSNLAVAPQTSAVLQSPRTIESIAAAPTTAPSSGGHVDLLKLLDVTRDTSDERWVRDSDGLTSPAQPFMNRLRFPYNPPPEYDYLLDFTVLAVKGWGDIDQVAIADHHGFIWFMGAWANTTCGIGNVRGATADSNVTSIHKGTVFEPNSRHVSIIQVRSDGIKVLLDGQTVVSYERGPRNDLSLEGGYAIGDRVLGLLSCDSIRLHRAEVTEINGQGRLIGRIDSAALYKTELPFAGAIGKTQSLLELDPTWANLSIGPFRRNVGFAGEPVTVDGKSCEHFIFAPANSDITYDIPAGAMGFRAMVVSTGRRRGYRIRIMVDGDEALVSDEINDPAAQTRITVPLPAGAKKLELQTVSGVVVGPHTVWANPEFVFPSRPSN
jgi:hypothetical protein